MKKALLILTSIFLLFVVSPVAYAADCEAACSSVEECSSKITDCKKIWDDVDAATKPHEDSLKKMEADIAYFQGKIKELGGEIVRKTEKIKEEEASLATLQELVENRIRRFYRKSFSDNTLLLLFSSNDVGTAVRALTYQNAITNQDKSLIADTVYTIVTLEDRKKELETEKGQLAILTEQLGARAGETRKLVTEARAYQSNLSSSIATLTAKQEAILAEKTGYASTSVGDVPLADDPASRPTYNPGFSPAFAAFSFGAPHFKGMSQYGALGRSKTGQNVEQILKAYYGDIKIESVDTGFNINTDQGSLSFEDNYLKGIAEMPSSWADEGGYEALKAQAIAARSYALAYTGWRMGNRNASGSICTSENCQVYRASKATDGAAAKWHQAVSETKGKILVGNGSNEVVNAFYASTSGGYQESYSSLGHTTPGFWDTTSDWARWADGAYEKQGGSPWFYKGWYKTRGGSSCGRSHPWLTNDEFADIVNAAIVYASDNGAASHLSQVDVGSCWGDVPDTWSREKVAEEAGKHGGAVSSVSGVSIEHSSNGVTGKVTFQTNRGSVTIDGQIFYKVFNLRAPGAIHLKSGLYNIEKK